ncbi:hypothetical protein ALC57_14378, partial [Trachymyrmex cornetzi]
KRIGEKKGREKEKKNVKGKRIHETRMDLHKMKKEEDKKRKKKKIVCIERLSERRKKVSRAKRMLQVKDNSKE